MRPSCLYDGNHFSGGVVLKRLRGSFLTRSCQNHYCDDIMGAMASQINSLTIVKRLFRHRSKKTSKLRVTGLCEGNSPETGEFPAQMARNAEMFHLMTSSWCFSLKRCPFVSTFIRLTCPKSPIYWLYMGLVVGYRHTNICHSIIHSLCNFDSFQIA